MRQPAPVSPPPVYGLPEETVANPPSGPSVFFPLLILVVGLAVATMWYVARPALDKPVATTRACEVIVLPSGATRCVAKPMRKAQAAPKKTSGRAKR